MGWLKLYDHQRQALDKMRNGCILCGKVGSGKSRTALAYYYLLCGGDVDSDIYTPMLDYPPLDLYIITTARKRDTLEWEQEMIPFLISTEKGKGAYTNKVVVDSWNNIKKYTDVRDAFFIFDEQRVVGNGTWVKAFLKITKENRWILLSATPGDTWSDYIPVFLANGFYKNRSEFVRRHVVYSRFSKYPKVDRYIETGRLVRLRNKVLVDMEFSRSTVQHHQDVVVDYDRELYKEVGRTRWNPYKDEPIPDAGSLCYVWRRVVNSDPSREAALKDIFAEHPRAIVFYNFDYELDILKRIANEISENSRGESFDFAEWNGHKHQEIPKTDSWLYLVQYTAGCEGWNCIKTDTIIFYSQNYSYKVMEQAAGRIDRINTAYRDLYYFHFKSKSGIDMAIAKALAQKKNFNEGRFVKW